MANPVGKAKAVPASIVKTIKKVPPIAWVLLAVLIVGFLMLRKGASGSGSPVGGVTGGGGGGGGSGNNDPLIPGLPGGDGGAGGTNGTGSGGSGNTQNPVTPGPITSTPGTSFPGQTPVGIPITALPGQTSPTPSLASGTFSPWGDRVPGGYGGDTYKLAQEYAYYILHPDAPRDNALFQKSDSELRNQLYGLVQGISTSPKLPGQPANAGFENYPEIPQYILALAGVNKLTGGYIEQQYNAQGAQMVLRPEVANDRWSDLAIGIPKLQSEIAQGSDIETGHKFSASELTQLRQQLASMQAEYKSLVYDPIREISGGVLGTGSDVANRAAGITYGAPATPSGVSGSPSLNSGGLAVDANLSRLNQLQTALQTNRGYVSNLQAVTNPTAAQRQSLADAQSRIASQTAEIARLQPTRAM